jgi:hypothetical protein
MARPGIARSARSGSPRDDLHPGRGPRGAPGRVPRRGRTLRRLAPLALALAVGACAELAPLRQPPLDPAADIAAVSTREEAVQRFGPPHEIRSSDLGPVLVYRRAVVVDANPNRYYGEDRGNRLDQYELVLLYVDAEGRIVRRAIEPE